MINSHLDKVEEDLANEDVKQNSSNAKESFMISKDVSKDSSIKPALMIHSQEKQSSSVISSSISGNNDVEENLTSQNYRHSVTNFNAHSNRTLLKRTSLRGENSHLFVPNTVPPD